MTAPRSGGGLDPPGEHLQAVQGDEGLHRAREAPALDPDRPLAVQELLDGQGAVRIQGGGFAGTVEAFVPLDRLEMFTRGIEAAAGPGGCHTVAFRSTGAALLVK